MDNMQGHYISKYILSIQNLSLEICNQKKQVPTLLLKDICLNVKRKQLFVLKGFSGAGKSLLCHTIVEHEYFQQSNKFKMQGKIFYEKHNLLESCQKDIQFLKKYNFAFIPQNPCHYFDPLDKIEKQLYTMTKLSNPTLTKPEFDDNLNNLFKKMMLTNHKKILQAYPYMLSRGTLQKIIIVVSILKQPKLIIADEPMSALDALAKEKTIIIFTDFLENLGSMLLVTHDLDSIRQCPHTLGIIKEGTLL